jgi:hypothetical protein
MEKTAGDGGLIETEVSGATKQERLEFDNLEETT